MTTATGAVSVYPAYPIKRRRRTNAELGVIYDAMHRLVEANQPMTLRGLFYLLVTEGAIDKTEQEYANVGNYLLKLRRNGTIPYSWIADHTRWMRKPRVFDSGEAALQAAAATYRQSLWRDQDAYVEIWIEKDTLAGVLVDVTSEYDVPLMVARGFSSETFLYESARNIEAQRKPIHIYLLTDHDPSGLASAEHTGRRLKAFLASHPHPVEARRVAVTKRQIADMNLPTRPTKTTDSRSRTFAGESVELDAIPAPRLRAIVRWCIERHINQGVLERTRDTERHERATLEAIVAAWGAIAKDGTKDEENG